MANTETADSIELTAARWVTRIDNHTLDAREREAFDTWVSKPEHKAAFLRLARHQQAISASLKQPQPVRFSVKRWLQVKYRQFWRVPAWRYGLGSIVIGLIAVLILLNDRHWLNPSQPAEHLTYRTAIGESFSKVLSDGSTVTLNTDTAVAITFNRAQRLLHLEHGEAYFEVAKDADRPFTVLSGSHQVQAVGTAFSVRVTPDNNTQVLVTEGKVALGMKPAINTSTTSVQVAGAMPSAFASAGQQAQMTGASLTVAPSAPQHIQKALAWREGRIAFSGEPLAAALQEFARYNPTPIVIKSPSISQLPIGGYFRVSDARALAEALADEFDLEVTDNANGEIWLQKRNQPK